MADYKVTLNFSDYEEQDLLKLVAELAGSRKLGTVTTNLIRLAYDNPELLGDNILKRCGTITKARKEMVADFEEKYSQLETKLDKMYTMVEKMYTLAELGKRLGLSDRSKNAMQALFMAEAELKQLDMVGFTIDRTKEISSIEERCEDTMLFMLNSYDNILNELKSNLIVNVASEVKEVVREVKVVATEEVAVAKVAEEVAEVKYKEPIKLNIGAPEEEIDIDEDDVDLSKMGDLLAFMGN